MDKPESTQDAALLRAANANNTSAALEALRKGANPAARDHNDQTAALLFSAYNNLGAVMSMAASFPEVVEDTHPKSHMSVAMNFAMHNNIGALLAVFDTREKALDYATPFGITPATLLAMRNNVEALRVLAVVKPSWLLRIADDGNSVAVVLAKLGNIQGLIALQQHCPELRHSNAIVEFLKSQTPQEEKLPGVAALMAREFYFPRSLNDLLDAQGVDRKMLGRMLNMLQNLPKHTL